ncbi:uncharacterized protein LOC131632309 [Vicia villosa]|uniref:uncharacterized protein LOC131632309 n=1 Tax=Vicia villosa TaxID=3911 RepID=UPI00273BDFDF|nr:uncharacterized protein LOC131632309 [Vicia villosa]
MRRRLSSWKCRCLSIGGRITLISSVLNAIPVYYLSFYKIPKVVLAEMVKLQREFLWCGGMDQRCISWVSWAEVCRSKKEGGLGVRSIDMFNQSMLNKWRWQFHVDKEAIWRPLLVHRYGPLEDSIFNGKEYSRSGKNSLWWRDLRCLGLSTDSLVDWFTKRISLADLDVFVGVDADAQHELQDLIVMLENIGPTCESGDDSFKWVSNGEGSYLVTEGYKATKDLMVGEMLDNNKESAIFVLWKTKFPSKI